jgi:DNA-directed RNA polymerase subunit RPC12/RpoP
MTERPSRTILHLKTPSPSAAKTPPVAAAAGWRCKPCGAAVDLDSGLADADEVRCPSCRALLGRAGQFRSDPPQVQRIRARRVGS